MPPFLTVFKFLLRWFTLFSFSVLLVLSLEQQWLHEPTCNVEILHRAQMGQDVYIYGIRTYHIYIYIYYGNAVHCGASVRELYDALVFHSTTYYHLHTSHITSFPGLPHLQLHVVCKTTGRGCLRKRLCRISNVCRCL